MIGGFWLVFAHVGGEIYRVAVILGDKQNTDWDIPIGSQPRYSPGLLAIVTHT
jgi:hypothetical protein